MTHWYGLDGAPLDPEAAGALLGDDLARRVAHTTLATERGTVMISTVFLVLDHNYTGEGLPLLWETMVFDGPLDEHFWRYTSRADAETGHAQTVTWVRAALEVEGVAVLADDTFTGSVAP